MHKVQAKGLLNARNGMNIYRGCQHGCIYCDSRSKCYQINHVFEDIKVKENAPQLLEAAMHSKRRKCMIGTGSMCDPYMPIEKDLRLTRECLELIDRYGFGFSCITKSDMVLRDLDLFRSINAKSKCVIQMTLTTMDDRLSRIIEPNVCTTTRRIEVLRTLHENGIPTIVWMMPILPWLNDTEENIRGLARACREAHVYGVLTFGHFGLTLREGDREYFYQKLDQYFPGLKERYINTYGNAYEIPVPRAHHLYRIFLEELEGSGIVTDTNRLFEYLQKYESREQSEQLSLF